MPRKSITLSDSLKGKITKRRKPNKNLEIIVESTLNEKQKYFCWLWVNDKECFANATKSYQKAYNVPANTARTQGSVLLSNPNIQAYKNALLDIAFSDVEMDRELARAAKQDKDFKAKVQAISEFNRLKGRVSEGGNVFNVAIFANGQKSKIAQRIIRGGHVGSESSTG